jgi:hypothetical protein
MSIEINLHDCTATVIEKAGDGDIRWTTYTFIDVKGQKVEVNVFHKTARSLLRDKLNEFVKERDAFETSHGVGS